MAASKSPNGIITPVLKYWGLRAHPFDDFILKEDNLSLFVNREDEVFSLQNALTTRLVAVYGTQGIGKSTFLRKTKKEIELFGTAVVYIHMTGTTEHALYREILSGILKSIMTGKIAVDSGFKFNVKSELERLEKSIRYARESSIGANMIATGSIKEIHQSDIERHTEESSRSTIHEIIKHKKSPFVVIIDDLERVKLFAENDEEYGRMISSFARTIDEVFSDRGVCFIISLDEDFVSKINQDLPKDDGALSFSFGELIRIGTFNPQHILKIISVRLKEISFKKSISNFITPDAFWYLCLGTWGHPRRLLAVLRVAMELITRDKKVQTITAEIMILALAKKNESVDPKDFQILQYLQAHGSTSVSDEKFQETIGITRRGLSDRIKVLANRVYLQSSKILSGTTFKDVYSVMNVKL